MDIVSIDPRDATPIYAQLERGLARGDRHGPPPPRRPAPHRPPARRRVSKSTPTPSRGSTPSSNAPASSKRGAASARSSAPRRRRRIRRASTTAGCARSSRACWPTPTPPASPSTMSLTPCDAQQRGETSMAARSSSLVRTAPVSACRASTSSRSRPARLRSPSARSPGDRRAAVLPAVADPRVGLVLMQAPAGRPAVGARRRAAARTVRRAARARPVLGRAVRRSRRRPGSISARSRPALPPSRR